MIYSVVGSFGILVALFILFEDILYKKIRNEIIYSSALVVFVLYLIIVVCGGRLLPLKVFFMRFALSGVIGIGMWYFKGWSAGDAKLFWLLSLFFPIEGISPISIFNETFIFLINIFLPVVPVLFFSLILDSVRRLRLSKEDITKAAISLLRNTTIAIVMMLISRVIYLSFFYYLPQRRFNLISMLIIFFLMSSISRVLSNQKMYIIGGVLLILNLLMLYIHTGKNIFAEIYSVGMLAIVVILIRIFYESVLKHLDLEVVPLNKLKKGDLLSREFIARHKLDKGDIAGEVGEFFVDGLLSEQVTVLRRHLEEMGVDYIERQRTFSFSVYIVIGYIFTLFSRFDNMILFVKRLFNL